MPIRVKEEYGSNFYSWVAKPQVSYGEFGLFKDVYIETSMVYSRNSKKDWQKLENLHLDSHITSTNFDVTKVFW